MISIKMRAEKENKHISGAEKIIDENDLEKSVLSLINRARFHEKGKPTFINIKIEKIKENEILYIPILNIKSKKVLSLEEGHSIAMEELKKAGCSNMAIENAFKFLGQLKQSMRGAIVLGAKGGKRLDNFLDRGIRATNMDVESAEKYQKFLQSKGISGEHAMEAIILASKVAFYEGAIAELCYSDDPSYLRGYVASKENYTRINIMKNLGSEIGGRVFFVKDDINIDEYINYIEKKVVLIRL